MIIETNQHRPFDTGISFALAEDALDQLADFKTRFHFPKHGDQDAIYFCGNSLGLQPKNLSAAIDTELETWRKLAVGGYFGGTNPWLTYQESLLPTLGGMLGAGVHELTLMNSLTVNLHLLMLSFYKPDSRRFRILMEAGAFPSDQYAVETLVKHYGLNPDTCIIEIKPEANSKIIETAQIMSIMDQYADSISLVMLSGMNYYSGQLFDMKTITEKAHAIGAIAGFDLAHVAGNVPVQMHEWNVDFAVWCNYKYLNAGPGAVGGAFIHERWASDPGTPRLGGWWGNEESLRFKMEKGFVPKANASGWNISTTPVLNMVGLKASLEIFEEAGIHNIRAKSIRLTAYLEYLLHQLNGVDFEIITPSDSECRGAQLSLYFGERGREIHDKMIENGIIVDYREPGVIRVAPAPLYCSYEDVFRFYSILKTNF